MGRAIFHWNRVPAGLLPGLPPLSPVLPAACADNVCEGDESQQLALSNCNRPESNKANDTADLWGLARVAMCVCSCCTESSVLGSSGFSQIQLVDLVIYPGSLYRLSSVRHYRSVDIAN